jgi:hypothetical protein
MRRLAFLGAAALATFAASARADDAPSPAAPPVAPGGAVAAAAPDAGLRDEVARQGEELDDLRAEFDRERRAREHPVLRLSGFLQIDWVVHNQASQDELNGSTGAPLNQDRFTLRRGHVRADVEEGMLLGALELDANTTNGPQVRPIEASVSLRWPEKPDARVPSFLVTAGLMRIPFGFEVQELDYVRPFLERATVLQALFPGEFDLGARFKMRYRFLDMAVAVMNGNPIGAKVFPDLDPVHEKDMVGRVGVDVPIAAGVRFRAGASADAGTGFHLGSPATPNTLVWQDQNGDGLVEPNEIVAVGGSPATPSKTFHRFAVGGDARIVVGVPVLGDLTFRGEAVSGTNLDRGLEVADPVGAAHDLREVGWSGGVTQEITRWGMAGLRYDIYNPNADATQQRAANLVPVDRSYTTVAIMGMVRYRGGRLLVEYDVNRNPLGTGPNGAPTTLADNALTLRGQLVF